MPQHVSRLFPEQDRERIRKAVLDAESLTSGEIVPYVVDHCDPYEESEWRCAVTCWVLAAVGLLIPELMSPWPLYGPSEIVLVSLLAGVVGWLLARYVPAVKRLFAGRHLMMRRITQRASEAFLAEEVFKTRERTGILIFVSLLERHVVVLGDSGINAKVTKEDWNGIVDTIVHGLRAGAPADAVIGGILKAGKLLADHGVMRRTDDQDELPDALRISDT